jgi:gamma-glutamyltranspeptidase / glutathione hydrolase
MEGDRMTVKHEVVASRGVVATNHPVGSAAGLAMLAEGGTAVDAAVAALFTLAVVEPQMVGLFGAGFFLHRTRDGEVVALDDYAVVPAAARPDTFEPVLGSLDNETVDRANAVGHRAAAVPGALAGWSAMLDAHGTLPLADVMAPGIRAAERGYVASPFLVQAIHEAVELADDPPSARVFLPGGRVPTPGDRLVSADLAATLQQIAEGGPDVLYRGPVGAAVAADFAARGNGWITEADLAAYELHWREPVRGTYRGVEITSMPPVSSGGTHIVQILRLLEGFDVAGMGAGSVAAAHHFLEALKLAFADRTRYMADPATTDIPVAWLTSPAYADERRPEIRAERASSFAAGAAPGLRGEGECTTHLTVVDADGGIVSATQTIQSLFGARVTAGDTGLLLNNCMLLMDPVPGRTNSVAPGKRVLSSMSPTIVSRDGRPWFALGTPGGKRIFASVTQAILNVVDHGMGLQEAVEAPRVWSEGAEVLVEDGFADLPALAAALERLGHPVEVVQKIPGGMNAILVDDAGLLHGAADWRADGVPAGLSGGPARLTDKAHDLGEAASVL